MFISKKVSFIITAAHAQDIIIIILPNMIFYDSGHYFGQQKHAYTMKLYLFVKTTTGNFMFSTFSLLMYLCWLFVV